MKDFALTGYNQMKQSLHQIAAESENMIQRAEQSYKLVQTTLMELKQFILDYTFKDKAEEITFFKEIKPMFLKELIYYNEVYFFEASKPLGTKKIQFAYYNQVLERIRMFFDRHQVLYTYYRTGKTAYDEVFFLRDANTIPIMPDYALDMDSSFAPSKALRSLNYKLMSYFMNISNWPISNRI